MACVSPLVNKAEPCVLSRISTSTSIFLTVVVSLPSILRSPFKILLRTIDFSIAFISSLISDASYSESSPLVSLSIWLLISSNCFCLSTLSATWYADVILSKARSFTNFTSEASFSISSTGHCSFPTSSFNS